MRMHRMALAGALLLAVVPAACGDGGDAQAELDRELDLALSQADSATLADLQQKIDERMTEQAAPPAETAPAPRPATQQPASRPAPRPAPAPAGPRYAEYTVSSGTSFQVRLDQELSTRNSSVGDLFTVTTVTPLTDGDRVVVPAGTKIRGEVTEAQKSGNSGQTAVLKVQFDDLTVDGESYPVSLNLVDAQIETKGRDDTGDKALKIGGGAAAGALLGTLIGGGGKGTLIGAAVGAAAGTGIQMTQNDVDAYLREGSMMTVRLDGPLTVRRQVS
ncbi:MAG: hypothetical protein RRA92_07005 [Gemmatimonadota bacterium]|nr:hypothetical protein [Gemmatimonadota bacterium]